MIGDSMDIDYLLLLQEFRNGVGAFLAPYLMWVSDFILGFWPIAAMCMLYWVLDRKGGRKILSGYGFGLLINGFLKLTFCIYRPWIRDSRVLPYGNSKSTATGYSFPSGHSTKATGTLGSVGKWMKDHDHKIIMTICWFIVLSVFFSRNYLGVHTPQDVIVGFASAALMVFVAGKIEDWSEKDASRDKLILIGMILVCIMLVLYFEFKTYPMTYLEDGSLLVNPKDMKADSYQGVGFVLMYSFCRYFEKRGFDFEKEMEQKDRLIIGLGCLIPLYVWINCIYPILKTMMSGSLSTFIRFGFYPIYILLIVPNVMKFIHTKCIKKEAK